MKKILCKAALPFLCGLLALSGCKSTESVDSSASAKKDGKMTFTFSASDMPANSAFIFKQEVPNGNYSVKISGSASKIFSETAEGLSPETKNARIPKTGTEFKVAVCDGVLDLTFENPADIKKIEIEPIAQNKKRAKPAIYSIGDSTTKNTANGANSWGNCVANGWVKLPSTFSAYFNHGMAGRDSIQYYNQARLEAVLLDMAPGDYVTINMGINSRGDGEIASYPALISNYYVEGVLERGGIPVILTATPDGPVRESADGTWTGDYNPSTKKFTNNRGDGARNGELRKIAAAKNLDIIEVGQIGEDLFNTFDAAYVADYNKSHGTKFSTPLEMVQSWYLDHNHYRADLGKLIGEYILQNLDEIATKKAAK